jgi:hypothetical protein
VHNHTDIDDTIQQIGHTHLLYPAASIAGALLEVSRGLWFSFWRVFAKLRMLLSVSYSHIFSEEVFQDSMSYRHQQRPQTQPTITFSASGLAVRLCLRFDGYKVCRSTRPDKCFGGQMKQNVARRPIPFAMKHAPSTLPNVARIDNGNCSLPSHAREVFPHPRRHIPFAR